MPGHARGQPGGHPGLGWDEEAPIYRQLLTNMAFPNASLDLVKHFNALQRTVSSNKVIAYMNSHAGFDGRELAKNIRVPALVAHRRNDAMVSFEEGRLLASLIPNARFLPLEGDSHPLLFGEPGTSELIEAIEEFSANLK